MTETSGVAADMAAAIAARESVSWRDAHRLARSNDEREVLMQLQAIEGLSRQSREAAVVTHGLEPRGEGLWSVIVGLATMQLLVALSWGIASWPAASPSARVRWVIGLAFLAAATILWFGGDRRARRLAAVYVCAASAYSTALLVAAAGAWAPMALVGRGPYFEAFLPFALWRFAREFPYSRRFTQVDRAAALMSAASAWIGAALFVWTFLAARMEVPPGSGVGAWLWTFRRFGVAAPFWNTIFALTAPALLASVWQARSSRVEERRRALWFLSAIGAGLAPLLAVGLLRYVAEPPAALASAVMLAGALSIPFTTSYVVLVHHVLPVRVVLRRTARYAVTRGSIAALLAALPLGVVVQAYLYRDRPLAELASGVGARGWIVVGAWALLLASALFLRRHMNRLLGVSHPDASTAAGTAQAIGRARTAQEASFEAARQVEVRLNATNVAVLLFDRHDALQTTHGLAAPLPPDAALTGLLAEAPVLRVSPDAPLFRVLPGVDQQWLVAGRFDLVARVTTANRTVAGLLAVGGVPRGALSRRVEEEHLYAIASTLGLALTSSIGADVLDITGDEAGGAVECEACGALLITARCECGGASRPARVPRLLGGKFAVERRIGQGGMGIVYVGLDIRLNRQVALKTLPQVSEGFIERLFDEAKTMAVVEHPNLALIYGLEIWRRTPILVVEYLPGGTLSDRLRSGPQAVGAALDIGIALTDAVSALHAAAILHRDIKPSNVGFTRAGAVKLLDFGVARFRDSHARALLVQKPSHEQSGANTAVAGTPLYLPPEALDGAAPDRRVDLWGIAVVTLEALLGRHPYANRSVVDMVRRDGQIVPRRVMTKLPSQLREFFESALAERSPRRPVSAEAMGAALRRLRSQITDPYERIY